MQTFLRLHGVSEGTPILLRASCIMSVSEAVVEIAKAVKGENVATKEKIECTHVLTLSGAAYVVQETVGQIEEKLSDPSEAWRGGE